MQEKEQKGTNIKLTLRIPQTFYRDGINCIQSSSENRYSIGEENWGLERLSTSKSQIK